MLSNAKKEEQQEQHRITTISKLLKAKIKTVKLQVKAAATELQRVQKNYGINTSVNYLEADDRIETKADLQQQRSLVNKVVEDEKIVKNQLQTYQLLEKSPYFGRIDIKNSPTSLPEALYIGTASLIDDQGQFLIHDWRAPIASVYYNGTLGTVTYQTPAGDQTVELIKKRQFKIRNGRLLNMFDTNETVGDELLQTELGAQSSENLRNIVATIQREQNAIIRDTKSDLLVVQGVAGSGKTSALLQRIAFLLYHSRTTLAANQILLFSPNRLFSNYISEVLPSLGEKNMRQVTIAEFFQRRLNGFKVQTIFNRFETAEHPTAITTFKGSREFITAIETYLQRCSSQNLVFLDIYFHGEVYFTRSTITKIYAALPINLPFREKIVATKNHLIKKLQRRSRQDAHSSWAEEILNTLSDEDYHELLAETEHEEFDSFAAEQEYLLLRIARRELRIVYDAIYNNRFWDAASQYIDFLHNVTIPNNVTRLDWDKTIHDFQERLEFHQIHLEDAAPLLYLRDRFLGSHRNQSIKYLFIDEVQDYAIAELMYLKMIFQHAKFNLIGDSEQALFKDVEPAKQLLQELKQALPVKHERLIELRRAYRSTSPITKFASSLLPDGDQIKPFNRSGTLPEIYIEPSYNDLEKRLIKVVSADLNQSDSVAVITKNQEQAATVWQTLRSHFDAHLISDDQRSLAHDVIVLPIYLAKGLEFDTVIGWDLSKKNYPDHHSLGIVYTMATRAMHTLTLLTRAPITPVINLQTSTGSFVKIFNKQKKN
ncbi:RNA polymerase recycling motor HelD [Fructilactobacillus florum]|uniref:RNA polymerase recycling motor HelD n=1 Tax=Fructilactobacillus florum TaxID=640331 RepID=UPI00028E0DE7|nr:RNA polymerase recycling motor HelD [Fructilactobacillus florum]EKK20134.1 DNA helicase [Fructilactobacillus florum 2F]